MDDIYPYIELTAQEKGIFGKVEDVICLLSKQELKIYYKLKDGKINKTEFSEKKNVD